VDSKNKAAIRENRATIIDIVINRIIVIGIIISFKIKSIRFIIRLDVG
jgi:hypothetical protein